MPVQGVTHLKPYKKQYLFPFVTLIVTVFARDLDQDNFDHPRRFRRRDKLFEDMDLSNKSTILALKAQYSSLINLKSEVSFSFLLIQLLTTKQHLCIVGTCWPHATHVTDISLWQINNITRSRNIGLAAPLHSDLNKSKAFFCVHKWRTFMSMKRRKKGRSHHR